MDAVISINSQNGEEEQSYCVDGDIIFTKDGFILNYKLGGDVNLLECNGKSIRQCRSGGLTYSIAFVTGRVCSFLFSESGCSFGYDVDVLCAEAALDKHGCIVKIIYSECGNSDNVTKIYITAAYKNQ